MRGVFSLVPENLARCYGIQQVLLLEHELDKPYNYLEVMTAARAIGATYTGPENVEHVFIVWEGRGGKVEDYLEYQLRQTLSLINREAVSREQLIVMGDDAPVLQCLELWDTKGTNARSEVPLICYRLGIKTIGEMFSRKRSEISGPRGQNCGNKTLDYLVAMGRNFGKEMRTF